MFRNPSSTLGFDDRWLVGLGVPLVGFFLPMLVFDESPVEMGWDYARSFGISTAHSLVYWLLTREICKFWRKRIPDADQSAVRLGYLVTTIAVMVLLVEVVCEVLLIDQIDPVKQEKYTWTRTAPISFFLTLSIIGVYEAVYYFKLYLQAEFDRERLLRIQVEMQLDALSKQVDPHFLFNSLNTLVAIIPEDPRMAVAFTERLSAVYRRLLEWRHSTTVTVAAELYALDDYLHLLRVRFEDRLQVDVDVDHELLERATVPLALQQLVENAVKHNEASRSHPLHVRVYSEGDRLVVSNPIRTKANPSEPSGFGLDNLRDRVGYLSKTPVELRLDYEHFTVLLPTVAESELGAAIEGYARGALKKL